ncbi:hypothetical protein ACFOEQ_12305 [Chryseobacterium arachidis]|uniref:hypothetical protein n=1 Tax=Chryseobacterium arachidis TaxID=1416778 RepID=UPI0036203257
MEDRWCFVSGNRQGAGGSGAIVVSGGNSSNLFLQQFYNGDAQVQATSNSTALNLSTHGTTASAPVTISTSVGGGALSTEKMRVTGEGNVGISTITPQVTLDVAGTPAATSVLDGIRAPRLTGDQLRAKVYTINQLAAIVYVTSGDSAPAGQTINVTTAGYYYFDGAAWQRMKIGDLNIYNSNGSLTSARTLTQAGFSLTFTNAQSTIFSNTAGVGIRQDSGTGTRASMALSNGGAVQMWLWSDTNAAAQVLGTGNSTSLLIGTTTTQAATPIIFQTSTGGGLVGTEKMRLLSNGNLGIGTAFASETGCRWKYKVKRASVEWSNQCDLYTK